MKPMTSAFACAPPPPPPLHQKANGLKQRPLLMGSTWRSRTSWPYVLHFALGGEHALKSAFMGAIDCEA